MREIFRSRYAKYHKVFKESGFRSGLELAIAQELDARGVPYQYEPVKIKFIMPAKNRTYTPDFVLNNGIIIEAKGEFTSKDRSKHLLVAAQHPHLDIRFVFSNPSQKIGKKSKTSYKDWCDYKGFKWAKSSIPLKWIREPVSKSRLKALKEIGFEI